MGECSEWRGSPSIRANRLLESQESYACTLSLSVSPSDLYLPSPVSLSTSILVSSLPVGLRSAFSSWKNFLLVTI